ncbi:MAG: DVU0298 family protein [Thermodesulfobacteriota bacterium]
MGFQTVKNEVLTLLRRGDLAAALVRIGQLPTSPTIKALYSGICHADELLHWHAVTAMGQVVAGLAEREMEAARIVMRRFMWSLNDESGGIGWGVPEAMAECIAMHDGLAAEYGHMPVAYMREDGYYLEYEPLQRGLMWGLGRIAEVRPQLLLAKQVLTYLPPYLDSPDPAVRGLAALALGRLHAEKLAPRITELTASQAAVRYYTNGTLTTLSEGELATLALTHLRPGLSGAV